MTIKSIESDDDAEIFELINIIDIDGDGDAPKDKYGMTIKGYEVELNLDNSDLQIITGEDPSKKAEWFESFFNVMRGTLKEVNLPVNIAALSGILDLVQDDSNVSKRLFHYLTDEVRMNQIVTEENLQILRDLFPNNVHLKKDDIEVIKADMRKENLSYSKASARGLFKNKTELPYELAEKIGGYLDTRTARHVAQASKDAAIETKNTEAQADLDGQNSNGNPKI